MLMRDVSCSYGLAVDIYAFGVLMWEVASLQVRTRWHGCAMCMMFNVMCVQVPHAGLDPTRVIRFAPLAPPSLAVPHSFCPPLPCSMVAHEGLRLELIGSASMPVSFTDLFRDCTDAFPASRPTAAQLFERLQKMRSRHVG
jgi:hypothetical protein